MATPAPSISLSGESLYDRVLPVFDQDEKYGWVGRILCDSIMAMLQEVDGIVKDWPVNTIPVTGEAVPRTVVTNLVPDPGFEHDTAAPTGKWAAYPAGTSEVFTTQTGWSAAGTRSLRVTAKSTAGAQFLGATMEPPTEAIPVSPSTAYGGSLVAKVLTIPGASVSLLLEWFTSAGAYISGSEGTSSSATGVQTFSVTGTSPSNAAFARLTFGGNSTEAGQTFDAYVDDAILVKEPTVPPAPYFDGDGLARRWTGTAGNSTSVSEPLLEHPGWSAIVDPRVCPAEWLPWCAQIYGVTLPPGASAARQREVIEELPPQKRGTTASMFLAAVNTLTGTKELVFIERYEGKAYRLYAHVKTSQCPSPTETENAILTRKPGGLLLTFVVNESPTWEEATKQWIQVASTVTWANVKKGDV